jgi:sec-independent protein translocase protein TatC
LKGKSGDKEMSFLEHLEELRWHIIRSVIAIIILMVAAFCIKDIIFDIIILGPRDPNFITSRLLCQLGELVKSDVLCINQNPANLININMAGQLTTHVTVSLIAGLILAFPVVLWEFWKFFKPALKPNEIRYSKGAVMVSSCVLFKGVFFGYFFFCTLSIKFINK